VITTKFNTYQFYTGGYLLGITPKHIYDKAKEIVKNTKWCGEYPKLADWFLLPQVGDQEEYQFTEHLRERFTYDRAPLEIKSLAEEFIRDPYFEPLRLSMVKDQYHKDGYMRNIRPTSYGLWNGQEDLPWHCDNHTPSDFFVIMYFGDTNMWKEEWGGQIRFGKENELGSIDLLEEHYPHDGTFAVVDSTSPLYRHSVVAADMDKNRYALSFRYNFV
jgi:hypothetical protein